jgi:hypothetical protein
VLCRIVGNALPTKQNVKGGDIQQDEQAATTTQEYEVKKTKTRTLLTNKKDAMRTSSRAGVRLDKIPEGAVKTFGASSSIQKAYSVEPVDRGMDTAVGAGTDNNQTLPTLKNQKITRQEQNFIKEYRHLEELEREKGIKFFQCVGDPPIT